MLNLIFEISDLRFQIIRRLRNRILIQKEVLFCLNRVIGKFRLMLIIQLFAFSRSANFFGLFLPLTYITSKFLINFVKKFALCILPNIFGRRFDAIF